MTSYRITPSKLKGSLSIPSSKSHTLRAILFALMGKGTSIIHSPLPSPDAAAMCAAICQLGAKLKAYPDRLEIEGVGGHLKTAEDVIQCGNSGQVLRFIGALAALSPGYTILTGDHSIRHNRPVLPLLRALEELSVFAVSARLDGHAPIIVRGPMAPGITHLSGEDSQPVSGLLIATAFAEGRSEVHVSNPGEKPWIDLTLHWFDKLGIAYENHHYERYVMPGRSSYEGFEVTIPGDFSSAAYPIAAALITDSELTLLNIDMEDIQGDKKLIEILQKMGAKIEIDPKQRSLTVKKGSVLKGQTIDINDFIDAITILSVIGCFAEGETRIINGSIARKKECDRIHAIATELKKMGGDIEEREDGLVIRNSSLKGTALKTHRDHRMVMSLSVAALGARGESLIEGAEAAKKTYPNFLKQFAELGAQMEEHA
jgi:3-phosphoshikimate 1-carboxyvinyltransferase